MTKIIVDAFGGDHAPLSVIEGSLAAQKEFKVQITLVGNEKIMQDVAQKAGYSLDSFQLLPAADIIPVEAEPTAIRRTYANSSMAVALRHLAEGAGDAVVSAGSTGALVMGATLWVKRMKGIDRSALGVTVPHVHGVHFLIDSGANSEVRPEMLLQFGIMGSAYMKEILGKENPRVGLINIGTEDNKGNELQIKALELLKKAPLNFIGNVEASALPLGICDVAVTDGFTGNIILKHTEGMAKMMMKELEGVFRSSTKAKLGYLLLKDGLKNMAKQLDASEYGGVPLLGISKPVIKAHGSSDSRAIKNAIGQGIKVHERHIIGQIQTSLDSIKGSEG